MTRKEKAMQSFLDGYNCSQCLMLAFEDLLTIDLDTALKIASPFGGGMGRLREVCGSVSGMFMVLGYIYGYNAYNTIFSAFRLFKAFLALFLVCKFILLLLKFLYINIINLK